MRKILDIILILGFLFVDWLIFHDVLKPGEAYTVTEILTGILSIGVFIVSIKSLFSRNRNPVN
jgi:hypothetical protein